MPTLVTNDGFMLYMPDRLAKGKQVSRTYFFNVLYSLYPEYVSKMVAHAQKVRFGSGREENHSNEIAVSPEMWESLNAMPFMSGK